MKEAGLACKTKRRFKVTTDSKHNLPIAPNYLDRQFAVARVNQVYAGDITYIQALEGWVLVPLGIFGGGDRLVFPSGRGLVNGYPYENPVG